MDELQKEENSPSIFAMSNLACKKSQPKHDEHPTHDSTEMNSSEGINELMVQRNKLGVNWEIIHTKINLHGRIPICPACGHHGCHVTKFAWQKRCNYVENNTNLTKPSRQTIAGGVSVQLIMAGPVLQGYFSWMSSCGGCGRNCHGAGVTLCRKYALG